MYTKNPVTVFILFSLLMLTACNLQVGQGPVTPPLNVDVVGTAVELTASAKLTEIAGSAVPIIATTTMPTFTSTPDSVSIPVSGPCGPTVTATVNANVRSGPGTAYDTVGSLMLGQTATIAGRNDANTWWYIDYPGISGGHAWIAGSVVTASCVPDAIQIVAAPPLPTEEVVVADPPGDDGETNTETTDFTLLAIMGPDLIPVGMAVDPNPATQGEEIHVRVGVKNQGSVASGSFTMQWWSSHSKVACEWTVPSLAPGESVNRSCSYTYAGWNPAYDIKLVLDSGNVVAETNEDNNVFARKLKVNDAP